MAVTANPKDTSGQALDAKIVNLTAAVAAISASSPSKPAVVAALDQAQRDAVIHYMDHGRITAANILSTLS